MDDLKATIVDLSEPMEQFTRYVAEENWDGRIAPVPEIWSVAFNDLFGRRQVMSYDFFYSHRYLIATARFLIRSKLERLLETRQLIEGKLHGHLAVIQYTRQDIQHHGQASRTQLHC